MVHPKVRVLVSEQVHVQAEFFEIRPLIISRWDDGQNQSFQRGPYYTRLFPNGNISVNFDGIPKARFSNNDGKHVEIVLKTGIQEEIDTTVTEENIIHYSEQIYQRPNQELFDIA